MILFLDGGYAASDSSAMCMESIRENVQQEELVTVRIDEEMDWNRVCRYLEDAHAIVLAADVYLDSVSARVLQFLERVEQAVIDGESIGGKFYAVLCTDLYEGEQTSVAMGVLKNFCVHANITWGRGLGIGGSRASVLSRSRSLWNIFCRSVTDFRLRVLREQALFIREKMQGTDVYINPEEVSRKRYIRKMNHELKKINRAKIAQ